MDPIRWLGILGSVLITFGFLSMAFALLAGAPQALVAGGVLLIGGAGMFFGSLKLARPAHDH